MLIDQQAIETLRTLERGGVTDLVPKIIDSYLTTSTNLMADLHKAGQLGDFTGINTAAHSLKSSSANVGAEPLVVLCVTLEDTVNKQNISAAREAIAQMTVVHPVICDALRFEVGNQAA